MMSKPRTWPIGHPALQGGGTTDLGIICTRLVCMPISSSLEKNKKNHNSSSRLVVLISTRNLSIYRDYGILLLSTTTNNNNNSLCYTMWYCDWLIHSFIHQDRFVLIDSFIHTVVLYSWDVAVARVEISVPWLQRYPSQLHPSVS